MFVFISLQSCPFQCESDIVVVLFFLPHRSQLAVWFDRDDLPAEITGYERNISHSDMGGSMAEWLERWTCYSEASSSSPAPTASWICSR